MQVPWNDRLPVQGRRIFAVSDRRLKRDIKRVGRLANGLGLYRFRYLWSDEVYVGVMAQEVLAVRPDAVAIDQDGFMSVDYGALGARMVTWSEWIAAEALDEWLPQVKTIGVATTG